MPKNTGEFTSIEAIKDVLILAQILLAPDLLKEWLRCFRKLLGFALGILYRMIWFMDGEWI
jgi:hypothetical protein